MVLLSHNSRGEIGGGIGDRHRLFTLHLMGKNNIEEKSVCP